MTDIQSLQEEIQRLKRVNSELVKSNIELVDKVIDSTKSALRNGRLMKHLISEQTDSKGNRKKKNKVS